MGSPVTGLPGIKRLSTGERLFYGVWTLLGFVVVAMYKTNLIAMLTTPRLPMEYKSVEELAELKHYTVFVHKGTYVQKMLLVSSLFSKKVIFR